MFTRVRQTSVGAHWRGKSNGKFYASFAVIVKRPKARKRDRPLDGCTQRKGGSKSLCLHFFTKPSSGLRAGLPFEILTVASREMDGRLALREVRVSALGTHNIQQPGPDSLIPDTSRRAWAEDLLNSRKAQRGLQLLEFSCTG